jgi:tRNA-Thr(GGU) m(6)t(6)A37 methyltransferase TsaA
MSTTFTFTPIGVIHSPFTEQEGMPIQSARSTAEGRVEIDAAYAEGLKDIEGFSHIYLLYVFDRTSETRLTVYPFLDDQPHGVFSTRFPGRPNPIGLSVVELLRREGTTLHVAGVDVLDGTPLLDLKPYVPQFDHHPATRTGWLGDQEGKRPWKARFK